MDERVNETARPEPLMERTNLIASRSITAPQPSMFLNQQGAALGPQNSTLNVLRGVSDSSNSDIRASEVLDHLTTGRALQRSPLHPESSLENDTDPTPPLPGSRKHSTVESEADVLNSSLTISRIETGLKSRHSTGQLLFTGEDMSVQGHDQDKKDFGLKVPLALGTSVIAATKSSASQIPPIDAPELHFPAAPSISPSLSKQIVQLPAPMPQVFNESDSILPENMLQPPIPTVKGLLDNHNKHSTLRQRAVRRLRGILLRKRVLSLLFGHEAAGIIESAMSTAGLSKQIPNLDGSAANFKDSDAELPHSTSCMSLPSLDLHLPHISRPTMPGWNPRPGASRP